MTSNIDHIQNLIVENKLDEALNELCNLLKNSPKLDVVMQQKGRFKSISRKIHQGVVNHAEATLSENQIRLALLELLKEIREPIKSDSAFSDQTVLQAALGTNDATKISPSRRNDFSIKAQSSRKKLGIGVIVLITFLIISWQLLPLILNINVPEGNVQNGGNSPGTDTLLSTKSDIDSIDYSKPKRKPFPPIKIKISPILIEGRVKDQLTDAFLSEVSINFQNKSTTTDKNGYFCIRNEGNLNFSPGETIRIFVEKEGYISYNEYFEVAQDKETIILLKPILQAQ